jgi:hypothetical protein
VAVVIWYEVLYAVNLVSKQMQAKDMLIDVAIEKVQGLISFFEGYRETGFLEALESAKEIALEMDIGTTFPKKRQIKRKRHYDENPEDTNIATMSREDLFRVEYFVPLVDQVIASLTTRFEQYKDYQKILVSYLLQKHCSRWMIRAYSLLVIILRLSLKRMEHLILMPKNYIWS